MPNEEEEAFAEADRLVSVCCTLYIVFLANAQKATRGWSMTPPHPPLSAGSEIMVNTMAISSLAVWRNIMARRALNGPPNGNPRTRIK